ncbi:DUF4142 domain-containing protein [Sphingomonas crocodyli]|uniref:DUF4142 domain-containing protein n=2 Tax=Sphingomonas crocodyli TaxID=1979270 RepID=A0A437LYR0_9SPHN|nr:DUF4142 domain-containing protein [Sphingomonas crocodyli]
MKLLVAASLLGLATVPAFAQVSTATTGSLTAADAGVAPRAGVSATDYVKLAADSDLYEIQSSRLAATKAQRKDVKDFAKEVISDHSATSKSLMAALRNDDRSITRPSTSLSADKAAKLTLLRKAPRDQFDNLYLQQQAEAHQEAWALHKGYATDGTDPALKQVASTAVPVIERHLTHAKQLLPAGLAGAAH